MPILMSDPYTGATVDATQYVSSASSAGHSVADIANALLTGGLALGDISQVIDAVQNGGMVPSQQAAALQAQLAYQQQQAQQASQQKTLLLFGALIAVAYLATRRG